jgi:hypothetical protein
VRRLIVVGRMFGMQLGVMLAGLVMMALGVQLMAMGDLRVMGGGGVIALLQGGMGGTMMMRRGFQMMGGLLVMIVIRHVKYPPR